MCAVAIGACGGTHLCLLRLGGHDEELRGWMDDLDLANDRGGIGGDEEAAEMVDDQLVAAWRDVSAFDCGGLHHAPLGPKLVLTRSESSATA